MNCLNCKLDLGPENPDYKLLCTPCFIEHKKKEKYDKCSYCNKYNIKKDSKYESCYTCNKEQWKQKKNKLIEEYAFSNK